MLSGEDNKKDAKEDMRYLRQPRGAEKSWVFKMPTPSDLIGVPNPCDGKAFRKTITRGLGTRHLPTARKLRDVALGDVRRLQDGLSDGNAFSLASAVEWREVVTAARQTAENPLNVGAELVLTDKLEEAEAHGLPRDRVKRFARVATGKGFPFDLAHSQYVEARSPNNPYGYTPLKLATVMNLDTATKHLRAFLSDETKTACLEDVTPELARRFRDVYLPSVRNPRSPQGSAAQTVAKNITLLKQLWVWAEENGHVTKKYRNPWVFPKGINRTSNKRGKVRHDYQPEEFSMLLKTTERGSREGDLIRLAIATGCRADELATIATNQVKSDSSGFYIAQGKTDNARRYIPIVGSARAVLQARLALHGASAGSPRMAN